MPGSGREFDPRRRLAEFVWEGGDGELRLAGWNAAARRMEPAVEEMLGIAPADLADAAPEAAAGLLEAQRERTALAVDGSYRRRSDGKKLEVAATLAYSEPSRVTMHLLDVSERRAQERLWRQGSDRFRGAFERSPIAKTLVSVDPGDAGRVVEVNDAFCGLFGCERDALIGKVVPADLGHPEDAAIGIDCVTRVIAGEVASCHFEKRFVPHDGAVVFCAVWVSIVGGVHGAPRYALCHFQDVTARRLAERTLAEREREFGAAFAMALDAMLISDDDRRWTQGNGAAAELFGIEPALLPGYRIEDFCNGTHDPVAGWNLFLAQGESKGEFQIERPDGEIRSVEFSARAHFMPGRHLSIVRDVTERKRSEEERARLQTALHQYQKLETVGQLAGGVAHDFNNLLAVILNACEFALEEMAEQPAREEVLAIQAAAKRAATLTKQLLAFSRQDIAQPLALDLNALVASIEWVLRRTIGENIELDWELDPQHPVVHADPSLLEQALLNLAVNARDAMPDGGALHVATHAVNLDRDYTRLHAGLEPGSYVQIAVSDTGCGMNDAVRARALEPFFTTKPEGSGTGLGLPTAYGIAKQHGGNLELYSEPGIGTVVKLYLPAVDEPPAELVAAQEEGLVRGRHSECVLVVEDDSAVRRIAERILRGGGYRVVSAANALEALAAVGDCDLVLTDVVMPGMSGAELLVRLRETVPGLPAIFMSGYTDRPDEIPTDDAFLQKPFSRAALLHEVALVLEGPRT